ncbi:MAG: DM13 domain-containing protein [Planctomycetota bacterium]
MIRTSRNAAALALVTFAMVACQQSPSSEPAPVVDSNADAAVSGEVRATGSFSGLNDHVVSGQVFLVETDGAHVLRFGDDFSHDEAPDPKVGFGNDGEYDSSTTFSPLKSRSGAQSYVVPGEIDVSKYNEVYVWCEQFAVPLAVATIVEGG